MSEPQPPPRADATATATTAAAPRLGQAEQLAQLQNILAGLGGGGGGQQNRGGGGVPEYTLTDVLPPSAATSLIASLPDASLSLLASYLPSSLLATSAPAEQRAALVRAVGSPEFRRAVASLERALRTGATGPLVQGLGLPLRAANGTEEFLQEVQNQADRDRRSEEGDHTNVAADADADAATEGGGGGRSA